MVTVPRQEHNTSCHPSAECHSRRGVSCDEGQDRLDALSSSVLRNMSPDGTATSGPLCIPLDTSTTGVRELETRSRSDSNRCLYPRLNTVPRVPDRQSSVTCQGPEGTAGSSSTSLEVSDMVSDLVGDANSEAPPITNLIQPTHRVTLAAWAISGIDSKAKRFRKELQNSSLLHGDRKRQSRMIPKWLSWCSERGSNPISGGINEVVNFLAHLFQQGYQY